MTAKVAPDDIEHLVGKPRSHYEHWGRVIAEDWVGGSQTTRFYILHSVVCVRIHQDLRLCPFSKGLDDLDWFDWPENEPVRLRLVNNRLVPAS